MLMLRWMSGHTLNDIFQNKDIRKGFGVVCIKNKMRKSSMLDWSSATKTLLR